MRASPVSARNFLGEESSYIGESELRNLSGMLKGRSEWSGNAEFPSVSTPELTSPAAAGWPGNVTRVGASSYTLNEKFSIPLWHRAKRAKSNSSFNRAAQTSAEEH